VDLEDGGQRAVVGVGEPIGQRGDSPEGNTDLTLLKGKGKGSPYCITERRVPELIPVLGSQPAGDVSHINPAVGCHYFPPGLHLLCNP